MATYTNQATIGYTIAGTLNTSASNAVVSLSAQANFPVSKAQSETALLLDTPQEYTITATNLTGVPITGAIITDIIPAGLAYVNNSFTVDGEAETPTVLANTLTYTVPTWEDGATHVFKFSCLRIV